jgi:predicted small secreted protein
MRLKIMAVIALLALSACGNTINGMGRDIEHAGRGIQETVQ